MVFTTRMKSLSLLAHFYNGPILDALNSWCLHRVYPNVRTKATIILNIHIPSNSSTPGLYRSNAVLFFIILQVHRLRTPTR